jgi:hypothetical protein
VAPVGVPLSDSLLALFALQNLSPDITIYCKDIVGPVSSLKHLSVLVILQSLLNLQAEKDYLRNQYSATVQLGQSA